MSEPERYGRRAEISVLGGMLIGGPEAVDRTSPLEPIDFFDRGDQLLFRAIWDVRARDEAVDVTSVREELVDRGQWLVGVEYLEELMEAAVTAADIETHVRIVRTASEERRRQRRVEAFRRDLQERADDLERDPLGVVAEIQAGIETFREEYGGRVGPGVIRLSELLADPEAGSAPTPIVDRLAWRGRVTLLAAREKMGKSTLASAAAAAVSRGHRFLDHDVEAGPVLYLHLEEHPNDVATRLVEFGADPELVYLLDRAPSPLQDLEAAIDVISGPDLVVLDTLAAFTESLELDPGSSADWTPIMTRLARLARDHDVALLVLHHARKSDGKYRDSTAIGAGVDVILEMEEGEIPDVRKLKPRGRWKIESYSVQYVEAIDDFPPYYRLAEGEVSLDAKVLLFVESSPGCSQRDVEEAVSGTSRRIREAVKRLLRSRALEDRGGENTGMRLFPGGASAENPRRQRVDAPPTHPETRRGGLGASEGGTPP